MMVKRTHKGWTTGLLAGLLWGAWAAAGVNVQQETTQVIVPQEAWNNPKGNVCKFANGDLVVFGRTQIKRSTDGGTFWNDDGAHFLRFPLIYSNGGAMHFYGGLTAMDPNGMYLTTMVYTEDNGLSETFRPSVLRTGRAWSTLAGTNTRIIQLSDGALLHCRYGIAVNETQPRVFVCRSEDGGASWDYVATVAQSQTSSKEYTESDLLRLANGEILCFIRSGSGIGYPLYVSRSADDGQTWSALTVVADRGVSPHAILMQNGLIAVAYGRPGDWIAFSADNGHTWTGHFEYYTGPLPPDNSYYASIAETEPGRLLAVYARTDAVDNTLSEVAGTFFRIERSAVAADADLDNSGDIGLEDLAALTAEWLN